MRLFTLFLFISLDAFAATYYVDTTNSAASDSNNGAQVTPWKTIGKATATVVAGDTVYIQPGLYNEYVTNTTSGSSVNPITFAGARVGGSLLTVIDPSTSISSWSAAPEINSNVWEAVVPFTPSEVTINTQRVAGVYSMGDISSTATNAYRNASSVGLLTGTNWLSFPTNVVMQSGETGNNINSWDGIEALWGTTGGKLYMRKRDGGQPSGVRASGVASCVSLIGRSYIIWSNIAIQNAYSGVLLSGTTNCTVVSNTILNGFTRIVCQSNSLNNLISGNQLTPNYYGYPDPGAWATQSTPDSGHVKREILYDIAKYVITGQQSSWDFAITFASGCTSNTVSGNNIYNGFGEGITINGSLGWVTNTVISGNTIRQMPSIGVLFSEDQFATQVYSNAFLDCNFNMRFHHIGSDNGTRLVFIYRNTSWQSNAYGDHIFLHCSGSSTPNTAWPSFRVYHNSFSAGQAGIEDNGNLYLGGQLTNSWFVNNVFSGAKYLYSTTSAWTNVANVGLFDYNEITTPLPTFPSGIPAGFFGSHNITNATSYEWDINSVPNFKLASDSIAINKAVDITSPFTIGSTTYPALPTGSDVKVGPAWDMGAFEFTNSLSTSLMSVGTVTITTIQSP